MGDQHKPADRPAPGPDADAWRLTRMARGAARAVRRRRRRKLDRAPQDLIGGAVPPPRSERDQR